MASFRTPPTLSRNLAIGTIAAVCRGVGLGHWFLTKAFARAISQKKRASMFAGYEPTERDVFVVTYPKSGTNWAMQIAVQTAWLGRAEFEHIYDLVAWPEGPFAGITPLRDLGPAERAPTGKRVIRSSLPAAFVPYSDKAAYIVVMRDPKEVMVSSYYFMLGLFGLLDHISLEQWLELFTSESFPAGPWAAHTHSYWSMLDRPNVLILHFAEMRKNLPGTVELVAELMGVPLDEEQLTAVVELDGHRGRAVVADHLAGSIGGARCLAVVRRDRPGEHEHGRDREGGGGDPRATEWRRPDPYGHGNVALFDPGEHPGACLGHQLRGVVRLREQTFDVPFEDLVVGHQRTSLRAVLRVWNASRKARRARARRDLAASSETERSPARSRRLSPRMYLHSRTWRYWSGRLAIVMLTSSRVSSRARTSSLRGVVSSAANTWLRVASMRSQVRPSSW